MYLRLTAITINMPGSVIQVSHDKSDGYVPSCVQVPDFTAHLTDELEAEAFVAATGISLPDAAIRSSADRKGPVAKVFLFSTKRRVPGIYKALAMHFYGKSRLLFGWTTPDDSGPGFPLMQKFSVSNKAPYLKSPHHFC